MCLNSYLQIVWDPDQKRWVNTDEGEAEQEAFKPPPKMSELSLPQQQQPQPPMEHPQMMPMPSMVQQPQPLTATLPVPSFQTVPAPVSTPMSMGMMMDPGQAAQPMGSEDVSAVDGGASRQVTNNLQSNQFKLQRNRSESYLGDK